ncbi:MAG: zinc ribbon domain-containing protein [Anaerolineaceae bacterium]|nr:zinc ribbon domain-containing protein [Anaerolineaceae bacterium]
MKKKWSRQSVKNAQAAVWLIGLGLLFLMDAFWPGILILIGISIIVQSLMPEPEDSLEAFNDQIKPPDEGEIVPEEGIFDPVPPPLEEPLQILASDLPVECPACGGPVAENAEVVKPAGKDAVFCPYCGTRIAAE